MDYLRVPYEISISDLLSNEFSWSAGMYRKVIIPNSNVKKVKELLDHNCPFTKGTEPGSFWYTDDSTHFMLRTKALQNHSCLLYPKGDAVVPINPKIFRDPSLSEGDILLSKDSNIGECVIVDSEYSKGNYMFSSGIVRLRPTKDSLYLFSFMKHSIFKTQLLSMVPRGATITHAKTHWLDCLIPYPNQQNSALIIKYVSALMQAIIDKENTIRERAKTILSIIQTELEENQKNHKFIFQYPKVSDVQKSGRLDAAIYDYEYKSKIWLIENYQGGYELPSSIGFKVIPGPSLEIKILKTRIDSDIYKPGFYALILPTNISEYGTMNTIPYIGTAKNLPLLKQGDIVFGEAGFHKGRSVVLLEGIERCTTNAHGLYARRLDDNINKSIFFRCIFDWYRNRRLIDLMAVGGSGGHFSPEYFDYIRIPKFPEDIERFIVRLYHNPISSPKDELTLSNFVDWHRRWNSSLGIWELDREMKILQGQLMKLQDKIIEGDTITIPITL